MKITFEGETLQHVVASIGDFLHELTKNEPWVLSGKDPTSRRKRRTKAEIAAAAMAEVETAEADAGEGPRSQGPDDPPTPRRRRARPVASVSEDVKGRTRSRRATAKSPSDELKDTDLSKAASALADATNPKVVLDLLEKFHVSKVGELEGDARREFVTAAAEIAADAS